ncbi:MAG: B-box zinc finger protein [Acidobacteriota bacterium]
MHCTHHPEAPAQTMCTRCDQPLCTDCSTTRGKKDFCPWCAEFLEQRAAQRAARMAHASPGGKSPAPATDHHAAAALQPDAAPAAADVYDGVSDVYAGPAEVYAGPSDSTTVGAAGAQVAADEVAGSMVRAAIFCAVAAMLSIGLWYGVTVATEKVYALVAIGVGFVVGFAALAGAGRGGLDVGVLSVGTYVVAILGGEFFSWRHLLAEWSEQDGLGDATLSLGEFVFMIPSTFSLFGWLIVGFGAWEAFKITTRGH